VKVRLYIWFLALAIQSIGLYAQQERYQHPDYDISFEASPNWIENSQDSKNPEYFVVHPNHNMEISLRFIPDCKRPKKYMRHLSGLKGLICFREGFDTVLNQQKALVMTGNCIEDREAYSNMLIGFPSDKGLFLMEISCPDNCTADHRKRLRGILQTVRIGPVSPGRYSNKPAGCA